MDERLYLDRQDVYILADDTRPAGRRALLVVSEHPDGADYAKALAALSVPVRYGPAPGLRFRRRRAAPALTAARDAARQRNQRGPAGGRVLGGRPPATTTAPIHFRGLWE
jgi:hypothetical protein